MTSTHSQPLVRQFTISLLALFAALCLTLVTTMSALADTVHIYDNANVLDASQVQSVAATLPDPIDIYTTNTFTGSTSDFDQGTVGYITSPGLIVIAIDTVHKHLAIVGGTSVPLSQSQYDSAVGAFISSFGSNSDYTGATIAAIDSLESSLGVGSSPISSTSTSGDGFFPGLFWMLFCIGLLLVIVGVIYAAARGGFRGYNQRQGMDPWVAGGLGYELGKEEGEREAREQGNWGGSNFWSGSSGNSGWGSSGDFGSSSSGNFGGGSSGNF